MSVIKKSFLLFTISLFTIQLFAQFDAKGNPIIRCWSNEYNERLQEKYDSPSIEEFEEWMSAKKKALRENPQKSMVAYEIPVIFHIIHDDQNQGATPNVGRNYINEQLSQINIDFANMAGSSDPNAVDTQISFCLAVVDENGNALAEPGINRRDRDEFNFTAPPWNDTYIDGTIKPATQWDPDQYCNIWVLDISGGLLGWAQFPGGTGLPGMPSSAGPAAEDGNVILYSSVGSVALPFPGAAPYNKGRTLTHEIGHWLGLRHIWGDGGCSVDDFCNDTPTSDASNFGCPNHTSCGSTDMVENYMDYTDDDCMNLFTNDQSARMQIVMDPANNVPRRGILGNSSVCLADFIQFTAVGTEVNEGTSCNTLDITVDVEISNPLPAASGASIIINTSSTVSAADYTISSTSINFPANTTTSQNITLSINQDAVDEGNEVLILELDAPFGGASLGGNDTYTINILDNDNLNLPGVSFEDEDFNTTPVNWAALDGGSTNDTWLLSTANGGDDLDGSNFAFLDSDDAGNGTTIQDTLLSDIYNLNGATNIVLDWDQYFRIYDGGVVETIDVEVFDGTTWTNIYAADENSGSLGGWNAPDHQTIDISAYANSSLQLRFIYYAEWDYWWAVDNVTISADVPAPVATNVNSTNGFATFNLGPNEIVNIIDSNNGSVMASIENLSAHDYGCTTVSIDNAGSSSYNSPAPEANDITDKNFLITTTNNNPNGNYNISLYYTANEITGWIDGNGQGSTFADLHLLKASGSISSATALEIFDVTSQNYNGDWRFTATVNSGFSGFALGNEATDDGGGDCPPNYAGANQLTGTPAMDTVYETDGIIESDQILDNNTIIDYDSGTEINLLEGFEVKLGVTFHAFIDGCGNLIIERVEEVDR